MKVNKKVIYNLEKCYSIAPLFYKNKNHILVAAEKVNECVLFDTYGNKEETIWKEPGGVMTMVQVPNTDGQFLATHKFYSPNDSKEAKIVVATPISENNWDIKTLMDLPHIHRFDILERNGVHYLIACTLKSGHNHKDDWSIPGKVYAGVLPTSLDEFNENNQLKLNVIKDNMVKNHGYTKIVEDNINKAIISSNEGVFKFTPPEDVSKDWEIEQLLDVPASDAVYIDIDGDGEKEIFIISHFHGDDIIVYKKINNKYEQVYQYENNSKFSHSIFGGTVSGQPVVIIGHREADRNLILFTYDKENKCFKYDFLDKNCGSANVYKFEQDGKEFLISTNREINEVSLYEISL